MKSAPFEPEPLEVALWAGRVGPQTARLWAHVPDGDGCTWCITVGTREGGPAWEGTGTLDGDTAVVQVPPGTLEPDRTYLARLDTPRGRAQARFHTAAPLGEGDDFAVAVMSCHQPFAPDGSTRDGALELLRVLPEALEAADTQQVMLVGDQMYADLPKGASLFEDAHFATVAPEGREHLLDCTADEVFELYAARYRAWFGVPAFADLCARFSTLPAIDDHELIDNFGSDPEHASDRWAALRQGAFDAAWTYQLRRAHHAASRPASSHYWSAHGPLATFVMDLRSRKRHDGDQQQIMDAEQLDALRAFLEAERERPFVAIVTSVPVVLMPEWAVNSAVALSGTGSDAHDRWSAPDAKAERDRLLEVLASHSEAHPDQQLLLLAGDVHTGTVCTLELSGAPRPIVQVVSSPVSNLEDQLVRRTAAALAPWTPLHGKTGDRTWQVKLLPGEDGHTANPQPELNTGLLRFHRDDDGWHLTVELLAVVDGEAKTTFRTSIV